MTEKERSMRTEIIVVLLGGMFVILAALIGAITVYLTAPEPPAPDFILYPYGWQTPENISIPSNITVNSKGTEMILGIKNVGETSGFYVLGIDVKNWDQSRFGARKFYPKCPVTLVKPSVDYLDY